MKGGRLKRNHDRGGGNGAFVTQVCMYHIIMLHHDVSYHILSYHLISSNQIASTHLSRSGWLRLIVTDVAEVLWVAVLCAVYPMLDSLHTNTLIEYHLLLFLVMVLCVCVRVIVCMKNRLQVCKYACVCVHVSANVCVSVCICVCVCERERERESVCVCVCVLPPIVPPRVGRQYQAKDRFCIPTNILSSAIQYNVDEID
jgi:hypothetical protein